MYFVFLPPEKKFMVNARKICFLLVDHFPDDDIFWFHQAKSLKENGDDVFVISTRTDSSNLENVFCFDDIGMKKSAVSKKISEILNEITPQVIICDNPLSVFFAFRYKRKYHQKAKILIEVTEWYPSKLNLQNINAFKKVIKFCCLIFLSFLSGCIVDKFIFGEYYKSLFFRILFPFKKFIYLPYFANIELITQYPVRDISNTCELLYSGNLAEKNGFEQVLKVAEKCAETIPNTKFVLKIISSENVNVRKFNNIQNLEFQLMKQLPFLDFCKEIGKSDVFLDLRKIDVFKYSLPIKIFYYMATGRPVIYSELKTIKKFFPKEELNQFGQLVNPDDTEKIVEIIKNYINDFDYYRKSCNFSSEITKNKYHWNKIKNTFIDFI